MFKGGVSKMYDGILEKPSIEDLYIEHYGVKGMKWGVRRYEKFDGTYTQRGVKKVKKHLDRYEEHKKAYKKAKNEYKLGNTFDKSKIASAKSAMQTSKYEANKAFKNLKRDKLADKGKELYKKGKRITNNKKRAAIIEGITGLASAGTYYISQRKDFGNFTWLTKKGKVYSAKIGDLVAVGTFVTGSAINAVNYIISENQNKKLRAFYSH